MMVVRSSLVCLLFTGTAALAQQTPDCVGLDAPARWAGGSEVASDLTVADASFDTMTLVPLNGRAASVFYLSQEAEVRVEAQAQGDGDPLLELRDASGRILLEDDDGGGERSARAETTLAPGRYCLSAGSFDGALMMVQMRVGLETHEPLTAGNIVESSGTCRPTTEAAELADGPVDAMLEDGVEVSAAIAETGFYRFSLDRPSTMTITATNEEADPVLRLYAYDGDLLEENDDDGLSLNARIDVSEPLEPGSYCLGLEALSDGSAPVTVSLSAYDPVEVERARFDAAEAAPSLDGDHPVLSLGAVTGRKRVDADVADAAVWYSVEIEMPGLLVIEAVGHEDIDPVVTIFDDLGRVVAENDDVAPEILDSFVAVRVLPGSYLFAVHRAGGGNAQGKVRVLIERYELTE
ncbi:ABC transporter substrate-binding protein [Aestuariibius insulae]|uniref:ABC transporter substrate-binding protein n=1 Tax=Aestuariibius insulae TaxID=2058287 RepID=UPI00345E1954